MENILTTFNSILDFKSVPKRFITELMSEFQKDPATFSQALENATCQLLPMFKKCDEVERGLRTIVAVLDALKKLSSTSESPEIQSGILKTVASLIKLILGGCNNDYKPIRYGSVWLCERILGLNLRDTIDLPNILFTKMIDAARTLLKDKDLRIRFYSIHMARKLNMWEEIARAARIDPSKEIRKQAVNSLNVGPNTVEVICDKLTDKDEQVRQVATKRLAEAEFSEIPMTGRWKIVELALEDRSSLIRDLAKGIIAKFFNFEEVNSEDDVFEAVKEFTELLGFSNVSDESQGLAIAAIRHICENILDTSSLFYIITNKLMPKLMQVESQEFDIAEMLLFQIGADIYKSRREENWYDNAFKLEVIWKCIEYYTAKENVFMIDQLIKLSFTLDLGEEITRSRLLEMYRDLAKTLPLDISTRSYFNFIEREFSQKTNQVYFASTIKDLAVTIVQQIKYLLKEYDSEYYRIMIEIINDLQDPLMEAFEEDQMECDGGNLYGAREALRSQIYELREELDVMSQEGDSNAKREQLQRLENEHAKIEQLIFQILERCLLLAIETLRNSPQGSIHVELANLTQNLIRPALQSGHWQLEALAVECLGLYCILKQEEADRFMHMFTKILEVKQGKLLEYISLKASLDIIMVYDFLKDENLNTDLELETEGIQLLRQIVGYLDNPDVHLQVLVAEGLCKTLLLDRIHQNLALNILPKLMIMFFYPEIPAKLKQCLHVFFTNYSLLSKLNADNLAKAFKRVLGFVVKYMNNVKENMVGVIDMSKLNIGKIVAFVFMYLDPAFIASHGKFETKNNYHFDLFFYLTSASIQNSLNTELNLFSRMLSNANILTFSTIQLQIANKQLSILAQLTKDTTSLKQIYKCLDLIQKKSPQIGDCRDEVYYNLLEDQFQKEVLDVAQYCRMPSKKEVAFVTPSKTVFEDEDPDDPIDFSDEKVPVKRPGGELSRSVEKRARVQSDQFFII